MLGEKHSIYHEFPEYRDKIATLMETNPGFKELVLEHDRIDKAIRGLEMRDSPIGDFEMENMKRERIKLKDKVFSGLNGVGNNASKTG